MPLKRKAGTPKRRTLADSLRKNKLLEGRMKKPTGRLLADSIKKSKKDKGPNTPGEEMRKIKGGLTMGKIRTKKMFAGDFDKGKKIRYQRRGK